MFFKLSLRNVKRSFKDYFIYFLTLTFAVCIFYSFNSVADQEAMQDLSASQSDIIRTLKQLLSFVSIFVSVILGFLIIFANNFLIKRRKKELGLYMTLGMGKYKISRLLVTETLVVGILSLAAGLAAGVFISQGLSLLTASMFDVDFTGYAFVFSNDAMLKTVLYFGIIYLLVMVFNSIVISRYKLIDLLTAARKNEQLKVRKTAVSVMLFILSLLILGIAYGVMLKYGLMESTALVWTCVGLGSFGTLLFFMSLSGFALNIIQQSKNIYFKDINIFVLRQINSKVNTTFLSMTIICLMLFFTIGVLSSGFSLKDAMNRDLEAATPYDASVGLFIEESSPIKDIRQAEQKLGLDLDSYGETYRFTRYQTDQSLKPLLLPYKDKSSEPLVDHFDQTYVTAIARSDYEAIAAMQGKKPVKTKDNEVLLLSSAGSTFKDTFKRFTRETKTIKLNGQTYSIAGNVIDFASSTDFKGLEFLTAVVPDQAAVSMKPLHSITNIQYDGGERAKNDYLYKLLNASMRGQLQKEQGFTLSGATKTMVHETYTGASAITVFIGIYLGIIFLISSAAVLALQQLSEASDNAERYTVLKKIGVTKKGINQAIFRQIFIYFTMPLSLAVLHSIFGVQVVNKEIMVAGGGNVLLSSLLTGLIIITVYGGYFLATYSGYKRIVK
ncbi:ABC transporter permease [Pseudobacillus badius]|uniref:ABC transporter permease n=1 Tax=Bacillus badius TaxID=1455 RepID=UPI00249FBE0C|nr:ABC transporter permease [Bacillus badius]GLY09310.1 ABC transporter permease [Bacillus badius]